MACSLCIGGKTATPSVLHVAQINTSRYLSERGGPERLQWMTQVAIAAAATYCVQQMDRMPKQIMNLNAATPTSTGPSKLQCTSTVRQMAGVSMSPDLCVWELTSISGPAHLADTYTPILSIC